MAYDKKPHEKLNKEEEDIAYKLGFRHEITEAFVDPEKNPWWFYNIYDKSTKNELPSYSHIEVRERVMEAKVIAERLKINTVPLAVSDSDKLKLVAKALGFEDIRDSYVLKEHSLHSFWVRKDEFKDYLLTNEGEMIMRDWFLERGYNAFGASFIIHEELWMYNLNIHKANALIEKFISGVGGTPAKALLDCFIKFLEGGVHIPLFSLGKANRNKSN